MRLKTEKDLAAQLAAGALAPAYLLCGSQSYLIEKALAALLKKASPQGASAFNLQRLDGKAGISMDSLLEAMEALPLMASRKWVVVDDLDPETVPAGDLERLGEELKDPPPSCVLIITVKSFPIKAVKGKKKDKAARLLDLFEKDKQAVLLELSSAAPGETSRMLRELAQRRGCTLTPQLASHLMDRVGDDLLQLRSEVEKVCAYAGGGTITREQIDRVGALTVDAGVFQLSGAILRRDYAGSLKVIGDLLYQKEEPTAILAAVTASFVDLYRAKLAKRAKVEAAEAMNAFGYYGPRQYRYTRAASDEGRYSKGFLRQALEVLAQADLTLKSQRTDSRVVLEKAVTQIFLLAQADRPDFHSQR